MDISKTQLPSLPVKFPTFLAIQGVAQATSLEVPGSRVYLHVLYGLSQPRVNIITLNSPAPKKYVIRGAKCQERRASVLRLSNGSK